MATAVYFLRGKNKIIYSMPNAITCLVSFVTAIGNEVIAMYFMSMQSTQPQA